MTYGNDNPPTGECSSRKYSAFKRITRLANGNQFTPTLASAGSPYWPNTFEVVRYSCNLWRSTIADAMTWKP